MMNVLHVNSYYAQGTFYKHLYDQQIQIGIAIDVYVPTPSSVSRDLGNYATISINHNKYDRYLFHLKHTKIYRDIKRTYRLEDYTVVHAHSLFSNGYIAMRIKKDFGVPYIVAVRDTDANVFFKRMVWLRKLGISILKEASQVIFLSTTYRDAVIKKYLPEHLQDEILAKCAVIPNGIDQFWLDHLGTPKLSRDNNTLNLLFVGMINKRKNIPATIKAIKHLIRQGYEVTFTVVGTVNDTSIFEQIKKEAFIRYLPHCSKEKLIEIYRNSDIFVMPSITETFGLVYPEAMSQGLPVIYTEGQGFDGQFPDGEVGFAVNCFDVEDIANKIVKIKNHYNDLSQNAVTNALKFCWTDICEEYKNIYEAIGHK
ncbi:glycosyltransferase family 4 protein [Acetobacterium wieringae]|uniref:glycosyltransferase family 4 protein n=1 Tax=Acetobacterium wieringae TaxID=52694 RepID=UPI0020332A2C|nr:glycosyltransferase family 4 protein [Acetobacterium wieringae]URN82958.1 glycosyltransferase family 4 protein [Acetobacterium wieringae]